jgi:hypothetical protein
MASSPVVDRSICQVASKVWTGDGIWVKDVVNKRFINQFKKFELTTAGNRIVPGTINLADT